MGSVLDHCNKVSLKYSESYEFLCFPVHVNVMLLLYSNLLRNILIAHTVKNLVMQETWIRSLGQEDPLEKGMATHSSMLTWRIYGRSSLAGYSPWACKQSDMTERLSTQSI